MQSSGLREDRPRARLGSFPANTGAISQPFVVRLGNSSRATNRDSPSQARTSPCRSHRTRHPNDGQFSLRAHENNMEEKML